MFFDSDSASSIVGKSSVANSRLEVPSFSEIEPLIFNFGNVPKTPTFS